MTESHRSKTIFDLFLAITTLLYIVLFALTPMSLDDYDYAGGTAAIGFSMDKAVLIWQNCQIHWLYDTGRLANLLAPLFLGLFPKIVFSVISGLFIWISVRLMCRLANVTRGSIGSWCIVLLATFFLPWYDYMFSVIFALNYVWSSTLSLVVVYWLLRWDRIGKALSSWKCLSMCVIAFIAGWMHEGFSIPVIAGILSVWVLMKYTPDKKQLALFLSYIAGLLLIVISPALWSRTAKNESLFVRMSFFEQILHGVGFNIVFLIFCLGLLFVVFNRPAIRKLKGSSNLWALTIFTATSSIIASALFYLFYTGPRMGWFATQFCSIWFVAVGSFLFLIQRKWVAEFLRVSMGILILLNLSWAVHEQIRLYRENKEIVNLFRHSTNGEVYYDNIHTQLSPGLLKSSMRNFNEYNPMKLFSQYWREGENVELSLLPSALKGFSEDKSIVCASDSSLYLKDGLLLSKGKICGMTPKILIKTRELGWTESRLRTRPFTAADSTEWMLIVPHVSVMTGYDVIDAKWLNEKD